MMVEFPDGVIWLGSEPEEGAWERVSTRSIFFSTTSTPHPGDMDIS